MEHEDPKKPLPKAAFIGAAILIAFLVGLVPGLIAAMRANREVGKMRTEMERVTAIQKQAVYDLEIARLRGRLGDVLHEANQNNFGVAGERATVFFDGVQAALANPTLRAGSPRQEVLQAIAAQRDEISADLARADLAVQQKLTTMYAEFARAVEE